MCFIVRLAQGLGRELSRIGKTELTTDSYFRERPVQKYRGGTRKRLGVVSVQTRLGQL
jgi:hypothetical protein